MIWLAIKLLIKLKKPCQNSSETVTNKTENFEHDRETATERHISSERRELIIDALTLIL